MAKPRRSQKIRTQVDRSSKSRFVVSGWLHGRGTYLWFGERDVVRQDLSIDAGAFYGTLGGRRLYRLAKAIVRHYEADK